MAPDPDHLTTDDLPDVDGLLGGRASPVENGAAAQNGLIDELLRELIPGFDDGQRSTDDGDRSRSARTHSPGRVVSWVMVTLVGLPLILVVLVLGWVGAKVAGVGTVQPGSVASLQSDTAAGTSSTVAAGSASGNASPTSGQANPIDPAQLVADFRADLATSGLTASELSDEDLTRFGSTACVFAASSDTAGDFEVFRVAAIAEADSSLTDAEMTLVIDTALTTFCPQEADRLGLS